MKVDGLQGMTQNRMRRTGKNGNGREGTSFEDSFRRNLSGSQTPEGENTAKPAGGRVMKTDGVSRIRRTAGTPENSSFTQVPVRHISYAESDMFRIRVEDGYTVKVKREAGQAGGESLYVELKYEDGTYAAYSVPAEDGGIDADKPEELLGRKQESGQENLETVMGRLFGEKDEASQDGKKAGGNF